VEKQRNSDRIEHPLQPKQRVPPGSVFVQVEWVFCKKLRGKLLEMAAQLVAIVAEIVPWSSQGPPRTTARRWFKYWFSDGAVPGQSIVRRYWANL
jgi:hypothetical protein